MARSRLFAADGRASPISKRLTLLVLSLALAFAVGELAARLYLRYATPTDRFLAYASFDQLDSRTDYVDGYHSTRAGNRERGRLLAEFLLTTGALEAAVPRSGS